MRPHRPQIVATRPCPPASPRAPIQVVLGGPRGPEAFKGAYWDPKGNPMGILRRVPLGSQRATRGPRKDAGGPTGEPLGTHAPPWGIEGPLGAHGHPLGGPEGFHANPRGVPVGILDWAPNFSPVYASNIALTPHTAAPNEVYAHASRLRCRHVRFCLFRAAAYEFPQKRYQHSGGFHVIPIVGIHQPIAKAQRVMRTQLKSNSFLAS